MERLRTLLKASNDSIDMSFYVLGEDELCFRAGHLRLKEICLEITNIMHTRIPRSENNREILHQLSEEAELLMKELDAWKEKEPFFEFMYPTMTLPCNQCEEPVTLWEKVIHGRRCLPCLLKRQDKSTSRCPFRQ